MNEIFSRVYVLVLFKHQLLGAGLRFVHCPFPTSELVSTTWQMLVSYVYVTNNYKQGLKTTNASIAQCLWVRRSPCGLTGSAAGITQRRIKVSASTEVSTGKGPALFKFFLAEFSSYNCDTACFGVLSARRGCSKPLATWAPNTGSP